jgi:hypothetical protein
VPKFKILGRLDADRIPAAVPPDYRERARRATRGGGVYTVVPFAHARDGGVTTSAAIRRAVGRLADGERVLAGGRDFTREATELLEARAATVVRIGEFGWTDESYHSLPR